MSLSLVQAVVELIFTVLYLSLIKVLVDYPTKSQFRENKIESFNLIKNQSSFCKRKILAKVLQLLLSLYKLLILLKIPCKIVLRIVKMLQNVEYPILSLINMLNFDSISGLKISCKFQKIAT